MAKSRRRRKISKEASEFGKMGGKANVKKYGINGENGMRERGRKGAAARWGKTV